MKSSLFLLLAIFCANSFAGDAAGHGGGTLPRILTFARSELIKKLPFLVPQATDLGTPELNRWYQQNHAKMMTDLDSLKLTITSKPIRDSFFGYESWIRVSCDGDFSVEYNPDVENYQRLVGNINTRHRHSYALEKTPSTLDVAEYLIHEIGHRYGLNEQDAWTFAQKITPKIFKKCVKSRVCHLGRYGDKTMYTYAEVINVHPSKKAEKKKFGSFDVSYHLDPDTALLTWIVTDDANKEVFHMHAEGDSLVYMKSKTEGGWWLSCD